MEILKKGVNVSNVDIFIGFLILVGCFVYWVNMKYGDKDE